MKLRSAIARRTAADNLVMRHLVETISACKQSQGAEEAAASLHDVLKQCQSARTYARQKQRALSHDLDFHDRYKHFMRQSLGIRRADGRFEADTLAEKRTLHAASLQNTEHLSRLTLEIMDAQRDLDQWNSKEGRLIDVREREFEADLSYRERKMDAARAVVRRARRAASAAGKAWQQARQAPARSAQLIPRRESQGKTRL